MSIQSIQTEYTPQIRKGAIIGQYTAIGIYKNSIPVYYKRAFEGFMIENVYKIVYNLT